MEFVQQLSAAVDQVGRDAENRAVVVKSALEIVWDPPWNKSRLSERGRELMQMRGVAV